MFSPIQTPSFNIGGIPIYGDLMLAPMDGITDSPFRAIARQLGSAMSYTEFINAIDVVYGHPKTEEHLRFTEMERPITFQIFDNIPERILKAALILRKYNPDFIDINMGCSSLSVSNRGAGAGLLKYPQKIIEIFSNLTKSLDIPVTGKIRLGWDDDCKNYLQISKIIEENGGKLIAVHARTRAQKYGGIVDWGAIQEIKKSVSIPVIGNGDVKTVQDINTIKTSTGCDGVMIGRAALGNPWIFSHMNRAEVDNKQLYAIMNAHLEKMLDFYGKERGVVLFRKHVRWYLTALKLPKGLDSGLLTMENHQELIAAIKKIVIDGEYT
jgi:tRNA-dihydrouridine synthase B